MLSACDAPGAASAGDLLREAEVALVQAQGDPTVRVASFDPIRSRAALERVDLEADLRAAIERRELISHYQPIIDLRTERIVGFEALARWPHSRRGLVPPIVFIPLAEETGLPAPRFQTPYAVAYAYGAVDTALVGEARPAAVRLVVVRGDVGDLGDRARQVGQAGQASAARRHPRVLRLAPEFGQDPDPLGLGRHPHRAGDR